MSTSLLYHGFGLRGYQYVGTEYYKGSVYFRISQRRESLRCPQCDSSCVKRRGEMKRLIQTVPIGGKRVWIRFSVPKVECSICGGVRQVQISFAEPQRSYSKQFERYALELSSMMTILDVARHLGVGWHMIKGIQERHLERHFSKPSLKHLERIAIDEISIGKGHRYLTVVQDLGSGAVVFVGDGKGAEALKPFWKRLRGSGARVKAVAIDMSPAYIEAVSTNLKKATIVFDHFHVVKLYNDKLSDLRRELYREATDQLHKKVLKGTRWLLLKNPENLEDVRSEKERLQEALKLNAPLATAYYMKEELRQLWAQNSKRDAQKFLSSWILRAHASGIRMLKTFANTLAGHREGVLAYYDHEISTGPLEGLNNKIKTLMRQAYGFRDKEFFKLKIYAIHLAKLTLVG